MRSLVPFSSISLFVYRTDHRSSFIDLINEVMVSLLFYSMKNFFFEFGNLAYYLFPRDFHLMFLYVYCCIRRRIGCIVYMYLVMNYADSVIFFLDSLVISHNLFS